jgi:F0F1-type ATP synthase membrane subunit b/b'
MKDWQIMAIVVFLGFCWIAHSIDKLAMLISKRLDELEEKLDTIESKQDELAD